MVAMGISSCDGDRAAVEDMPQYTNAANEEVYGPDYRPTSPSIESVPLLVGRPNAGFKVPVRLRNLGHEALLAPATLGLSATSDALIDEMQLPLLKGHASRSVSVGPLVETSTDATATVTDDDIGAAIELADSLGDAGEPSIMTIHYVFVGQGDGAIVEFPCGVAVIDTGGEFGGGARENGGEMFIEYLTEFFADRPDLNNTIDVLFTTHPHADHLNGLPLLVDDDGELIFTVNNVVDNGQTGASGSLKKQTVFRKAVKDSGGDYSAVELSRQVAATGATNAVIDPFDCDDVDPIITAFWGGINDELPAGDLISASEYSTPNNHSVIVRIDFGAASFLFTGDLEDRGERDLRGQYEDNLEVFDVDIYQVSHHGADNDTSDELLVIMSPDIAVISMGTPDLDATFTAMAHGHPRMGLLAVLQEEPGVIFDLRDPAREFLAAPGHNIDFENVLIEQAIFGTGWEGTILIEANTLGEYEIFTD